MQAVPIVPNLTPVAPGQIDVHASRLLVVDDDEANRESLRRRLARAGFVVDTAADGSSALELIERSEGGAFDLVLLDVMMPGMSGLEVLERVRQRLSHTDLPIIMATANSQSEDIVGALNLGANDYVTKPLDFAVVLARLRTQLQLKKNVDRVVDLEKHLIARNIELEAANEKLERHAARTGHELAAAAKIQKTFLPPPAPAFPGAAFAWAFEPCQELAGDALNILQLDADHVAFYVLDVSGHGVAASLLAVTAMRLLSAVGHGDSIVLQTQNGVTSPVPPAQVAATLNERFAWNPETSQFMTLFYALYHVPTRLLTYVSAGHPGAVHLRPGGGDCHEPRMLDGTGLPIGIGEEYEQQAVQLEPGDRVYLYSDGVTEAMNPLQQLFGTPRLVSTLCAASPRRLADSIAVLQATILQWHDGNPAKDDISVLALECQG